MAAADSAAAPAGGTGPGDGGQGGGGAGGGAGRGTVPGTGDGRGPGAGGGGGVIRPPELRDLAFPFETPPKELRGASLDVTFWVRVDGTVERYEVQPVITDRDYARKFDEVIRAFRFTPARAPDGSQHRRHDHGSPSRCRASEAPSPHSIGGVPPASTNRGSR